MTRLARQPELDEYAQLERELLGGVAVAAPRVAEESDDEEYAALEREVLGPGDHTAPQSPPGPSLAGPSGGRAPRGPVSELGTAVGRSAISFNRSLAGLAEAGARAMGYGSAVEVLKHTPEFQQLSQTFLGDGLTDIGMAKSELPPDAGLAKRALYGGINLVGENAFPMAGAIGLTAATGGAGAGPIVASLAGAAPIAAQAAGTMYNEAKAAGAPEGEALKAAIVSGVTNQVLGALPLHVLFNKIPGLQRTVNDSIGAAVGKYIAQKGVEATAGGVTNVATLAADDAVRQAYGVRPDAFDGFDKRAVDAFAGGAALFTLFGAARDVGAVAGRGRLPAPRAAAGELLKEAAPGQSLPEAPERTGPESPEVLAQALATDPLTTPVDSQTARAAAEQVAGRQAGTDSAVRQTSLGSSDTLRTGTEATAAPELPPALTAQAQSQGQPSPQSTPPAVAQPETTATTGGMGGEGEVARNQQASEAASRGDSSTVARNSDAIDADAADHDPTLTAAKNEWMNRDRASLGLDQVDSPARRSWSKVLSEAKDQKVNEKATALATEVIAKPRSLTDIETAGVVVRAAQIKKDHAQLTKEIGESKDPADVALKSAEANRLQGEFDTLTEALKKAGTEAGRQLAVRRLTLDQDLSLVAVKARAKAAKGAELSAEEGAKFKDLTDKLTKAEAALVDLQSRAKHVQADRAIRSSGRRLGSKLDPAQRAEKIKELSSKAQALLKAGCL